MLAGILTVVLLVAAMYSSSNILYYKIMSEIGSPDSFMVRAEFLSAGCDSSPLTANRTDVCSLSMLGYAAWCMRLLITVFFVRYSSIILPIDNVVAFSSASSRLWATSLEFSNISRMAVMMLAGVADILPSGSSDRRYSFT